MARFRATIKGSKGEASRLGTAKSGLVVNVNGWNVGVRVTIGDEDGQDVIHVHRTGGSNNKVHAHFSFTIKEKDA